MSPSSEPAKSVGALVPVDSAASSRSRCAAGDAARRRSVDAGLRVVLRTSRSSNKRKTGHYCLGSVFRLAVAVTGPDDACRRQQLQLPSRVLSLPQIRRLSPATRADARPLRTGAASALRRVHGRPTHVIAIDTRSVAPTIGLREDRGDHPQAQVRNEPRSARRCTPPAMSCPGPGQSTSQAPRPREQMAGVRRRDDIRAIANGMNTRHRDRQRDHKHQKGRASPPVR